MGNAYMYTECDHCRKSTSTDNDFLVHGGHGLGKLQEMIDLKWPVGRIASHFCRYCGNYVELSETQEITEKSCGCGHFEFQGYTYPKGDVNYWELPKGWGFDEEPEESDRL